MFSGDLKRVMVKSLGLGAVLLFLACSGGEPPAAVSRDMVLVPGGVFRMGFADAALLMKGSKIGLDEKPVITVELDSFYMDVTEVTQGDYMLVMGEQGISNPSEFPGDMLPVENVTWEDAIAYCNALSIREGLEPCYSGEGYNTVCNRGASGYRLPTEAEWEYAARGGPSPAAPYIYSGAGLRETISLGDADRIGWYLGNSGVPDGDGGLKYLPRQVKTKEPNDLGIYDLSGNVWEWCWDWYGVYNVQRVDPDDHSSAEIPHKNPLGPNELPEERGRFRVIRGGAYNSPDSYFDPDTGVPIVDNMRNTYRGKFDPRRGHISIGFRTVRKAL